MSDLVSPSSKPHCLQCWGWEKRGSEGATEWPEAKVELRRETANIPRGCGSWNHFPVSQGWLEHTEINFSRTPGLPNQLHGAFPANHWLPAPVLSADKPHLGLAPPAGLSRPTEGRPKQQNSKAVKPGDQGRRLETWGRLQAGMAAVFVFRFIHLCESNRDGDRDLSSTKCPQQPGLCKDEARN